MSLPYPPPYQDAKTLAAHICLGETTIEEYVAAGLLPRPRKGKGVPLYDWEEVKVYIRGWPVAGPGAVKAHSPPQAPGGSGDITERVRLAAERASRGSAA